ncbi:MAG: hypothetical protein AB7G44_08035 [Bacteroidia bacterium]
MKRLINIGLILTSLIGYLEWGTESSTFLFQAELEVFRKFFINPLDVLHPFVLLPLFGQLLLLFTLFQKTPGRVVSLAGLSALSLLMLLLLFIGIISFNWKILVSSLPFIITGVFAVRMYWKKEDIK